jgi:hypothetical protein
MDQEMLNHEIEVVQKDMANTDPSTDKYAALVDRLEHLQKLNDDHEHHENDKKHYVVDTIVGIGKVALKAGMFIGAMFVSHYLTTEDVFNKDDKEITGYYMRDQL